ncbi:hypothetical protein SAMN02194393_01668 [Maledivibacter halophilus]|uniref:Uncharacterized protein n=1 Tax=Maledivibacter halophilus TaxID=36842 RepID=A0A1T5K6A2_9FIRM|nr:hypothetical protein SAMN02194393_01668 [Maledivibacter halophilus]
MDERKLRLYRFMLDNEMRNIEQIPEPYRSELS